LIRRGENYGEEKMIKLYNQADFLAYLSQAGALTVAANADAVMSPLTGFLIGIWANIGAVGTGTIPVIDVLQNETTIWGATKISFPASSRAATYGALTTNPLPVTAGDVFTLVVTTAFGTTQSKDLSLALLFRRAFQSAPSAAILGDFGLLLGNTE
jgi:hypothetical protein